ncbi:hypothetical protein VBD025_15115 [Virgibacillus flavescens]|uniref:hypothetical protein n=1 Tax=Virgibacillus flavescens TaxID=1611422 RepID=UPI003D353B25
MLKVRMKLNGKRFMLPIPYTVLNGASLVITSKRLTRLLNKAIAKNGSQFVFPEIERKDLKRLLKEFSKHRGVTLVDMRASDGTEVEVKL